MVHCYVNDCLLEALLNQSTSHHLVIKPGNGKSYKKHGGLKFFTSSIDRTCSIAIIDHWSPEGIYYYYGTELLVQLDMAMTRTFFWKTHLLMCRFLITMSMCWMVVVITGKSLVMQLVQLWCLCHEKNYENNENIEMDLSESRLHQTLILKNDGLSSFHDISPSNVLSIWRVTSPCHHIHIPCGTIISYPTISHYMMWI